MTSSADQPASHPALHLEPSASSSLPGKQSPDVGDDVTSLEATQRDRVLRQAAHISVWVGVIILMIKVSAWIVTGSAAIMGDALESIVHVIATVVMMISLHITQRPPDEHHPYGHGKAASFSISFEGGLVALSGLMVLFTVVDRIVNGGQPASLGWGMLATGLAITVLGTLGGYLLWIGKRYHSRMLVADAHHVLADAWTSIGVIVGLGLVQLTGLMWLDWLVALAVAVHLLWVGGSLLQEGTRGLMGHADKAELATIIETLNRLNDTIEQADLRTVHRLRLHPVGELRHLDFHLNVPAAMTIAASHHLHEQLETHILQDLGHDGSVMIHFDVADDSISHHSQTAMPSISIPSAMRRLAT